MTSGPALGVGTRILPLHRSVNLLGRSTPAAPAVPDVDLAPDDADRRVSRRHAELACRPGATEVTDLGSANGTYRNGTRLEPGGQRVRQEDLQTEASKLQAGEERFEAGPDDIVIVPPDTPHKFTNNGPGSSNLVCIHANPTMVTEWLE